MPLAHGAVLPRELIRGATRRRGAPVGSACLKTTTHFEYRPASPKWWRSECVESSSRSLLLSSSPVPTAATKGRQAPPDRRVRKALPARPERQDPRVQPGKTGSRALPGPRARPVRREQRGRRASLAHRARRARQAHQAWRESTGWEVGARQRLTWLATRSIPPAPHMSRRATTAGAHRRELPGASSHLKAQPVRLARTERRAPRVQLVQLAPPDRVAWLEQPARTVRRAPPAPLVPPARPVRMGQMGQMALMV